MRYCFLRFPEGKFKAVTLSYDDGVRADLRLIEILNQNGMKGTFNLNSALLNISGKLTWEEIADKILGAGHEVAVHGEFHIAPGAVQPTLAIRDILNCRLALEEKFGQIFRGMAYPDSGIRLLHGGNGYEVIREYVKDLGIAYARTLGGDNDAFLLPNDFYAWMPTAHHANPNLKAWTERFLALKENAFYSANRFPRLFYLWGHSYEFDRADNWDVIEDFCSTISGKSDTWYATNIEICEYTQAYRSLVMSADGRMIYNPASRPVWIDADAVCVRIDPGETVTLA